MTGAKVTMVCVGTDDRAKPMPAEVRKILES